MAEENQISDEDIQYFNTNCKNIEDLEALIPKLEYEKSENFYEICFYLSNFSSCPFNIDYTKNAFTSFYNYIDNDQFPFEYISSYLDRGKLYDHYLKYKEKIKLDLDLDLDLDSNLEKLGSHFESINGQNLYIKWDDNKNKSECVCKYLKNVHNYIIAPYLFHDFSEKKISEASKMMKKYQNSIIDFKFEINNMFLPFIFYGKFLLDKPQEILLNKHLERMIKYYLDYIFQNAPNTHSLSHVCKFLYEEIKKQFNINNPFIKSSQRIYPILEQNLISQLIDRFPKVKHKFCTIDYKNGNSIHFSDFSELEHYETECMINALDINNFYKLLNLNLKNERIKNFFTKLEPITDKKIKPIDKKLTVLYKEINESKVYDKLQMLFIFAHHYQNKYNFTFEVMKDLHIKAYNFSNSYNFFKSFQLKDENDFKDTLQLFLSTFLGVKELTKDLLFHFQYDLLYYFTYGYLDKHFSTFKKSNINDPSNQLPFKILQITNDLVPEETYKKPSHDEIRDNIKNAQAFVMG